MCIVSSETREYPCFVSCNHVNGVEECDIHIGWGDTWEEAFADADARARGGKGERG